MSMPGFTAEPALSVNGNYQDVIAALFGRGAPGPGSCFADCLDTCQTQGISSTSCSIKCSTMCNSGPITAITSAPPSPQNCDLCKAGCWSWWVACDAIPGVVVGGVLDASHLALLLGKDVVALLGVAFQVVWDLPDPCAYVRTQCIKGCPC
jgi:hypothetical protein